MGIPNFSITSGSNDVRGMVWGLVPHYATDEEVQEEIENGDWVAPYDTDNIREYMYQDSVDDVKDMYAFIEVSVSYILDEAVAMWGLYGFDWDVFPYTITIEQGHHAGFSVGIVDKSRVCKGINTESYRESVWDFYATWYPRFFNTGLTYENYWGAVDKVADFMQWAIDQMARCYELQVVTGDGFTQSTEEFNWDEYEPHNQATKWAERYPQFNHKLLWDEFGSLELANKVNWRERKLNELKSKPVWSLWVGGVEVTDHYVTWYVADYKAKQYRQDGYDDVAIMLNK